jgi:hypothetical protein
MRRVVAAGAVPDRLLWLDAGLRRRLRADGVSQRLAELQRAGDIAGMAATITDEMLEVYAITATWDEMPGRIVEKYRDVADRIILCFATEAWEKGAQHLERWQEMIARTRAVDRARGSVPCPATGE